MYCINCGVKLQDTEKSCPLCGTRVYHPDLNRQPEEPLYPVNAEPELQRRSLVPQAILTVLFLLPLLIVFQCDLLLNQAVTWSGFVIGALIVSYVMLVLPLWFHRPNPVIFVPCSFAAVCGYVLYIDLALQGGWFLSFAFPLIGGLALIVTAVVALLRYVKKGLLYIFGGAFIALGGLMLPVEFLAEYTFGIPKFEGWALYPLTVLVLLGGFLIFLAIYRPAREAVERKLFI